VETLRETVPNLRDLSNGAEVADDRSAADYGTIGEDSGRSNGASAPAAGG
jgi:hypothetical protein